MLTVMVFALGSVSGAHFNPAVSLAITLRGKMPVDLMFYYMGAQITGGLLLGHHRWRVHLRAPLAVHRRGGARLRAAVQLRPHLRRAERRDDRCSDAVRRFGGGLHGSRSSCRDWVGKRMLPQPCRVHRLPRRRRYSARVFGSEILGAVHPHAIPRGLARDVVFFRGASVGGEAPRPRREPPPPRGAALFWRCPSKEGCDMSVHLHILHCWRRCNQH